MSLVVGQVHLVDKRSTLRDVQVMLVGGAVSSEHDLERHLMALGASVAHAVGSAPRLSEQARTGAPDVIFVDAELDNGEAGTVLAEVLAAEAPVPVVLVADPESAAYDLKEDPTVPCVYAPFRDAELVDAIRVARRLDDLEVRLGRVERRLDATLASIGEGVVATDALGAVTFLNPLAETITGWSLDEALGRPVEEVFPLVEEAGPTLALHPAREAVKLGQTVCPSVRLCLKNRSGRRLPIEVSAGPIVPTTGPIRPLGVVVAFRDVAEQRRVEEALRESEARYRAVVEDQAEFIVRWLPDGTRTFVNDAYARYFGATPEELIGESFFPLIETEAERQAIRDAVASLTPESPIMTEVHRARRFDGAWRWQEWTDRGLFDADGSLIALQSVGRDVHERVAAEEELRRSQERFQAIFDQAFQFAGLLSTDGRLLDVNRTALAFIGAEADDVLGDYFWETPWWSHSPEQKDWLRRMIERAAGGELVRAEVEHVAPDGTLHTIDFSLKPVRAEDGRIHLLIPEGRDITEQKRLEEQLRQSQKMQAIGQLAGGVAHDFNNLLTVITGYGDLLSSELSDVPDHLLDAISSIQEAGDRAALLTRQLLAFSRKQHLEPQVLDLGDLVRRAETMLGRLIEKDVSQTFRLAPELRPVRVDPGQMEQVILNLALNARDAMSGGGTLTIETHNLDIGPDDDVPPGLEPGPHVVLSVADTGCGMPEEVRTRVFEPFFTTKEAGRGTGLGLSTVYGIVEQSGGHIALDTEVGQGTTFEIVLPACIDCRPADESGSGAQSASRGPATILLVEDEDSVRDISRIALTRHGYTVLEAAGGAEAMEIVRGHQGALDLVVSDLVMPGMRGTELAKRLRALRPDIKIVFVSGYTEVDLLRDGTLEGHDGFLAKPFTPTQLAEKVGEVLPARS